VVAPGVCKQVFGHIAMLGIPTNLCQTCQPLTHNYDALNIDRSLSCLFWNHLVQLKDSIQAVLNIWPFLNSMFPVIETVKGIAPFLGHLFFVRVRLYFMVFSLIFSHRPTQTGTDKTLLISTPKLQKRHGDNKPMTCFIPLFDAIPTHFLQWSQARCI